MELKAAKLVKFGPTGRFPHVLWDGFQRDGVDPQICIEQPDAEVFNADLPGESKNMRVETEPHRCTLPRLPEVSLTTL